MKIVLVIQARLGSTRLPRKVLLPLAGRPMLERMIERLQAITTPVHLVVATTTDRADDSIQELSGRLGINCYRGHPTDLLDRHYQAGMNASADAVVKIPSDCPLIDPDVVDRVLSFYLKDPLQFDYVSNLHPATYPDGNDVEIIPMGILEKAWRLATKPFEREHTTPFIWERPDQFRIGNVLWQSGLNYSMTHRWTVDYPEDYLFVKKVFERLWRPEDHPFSLAHILGLLDTNPDIRGLNAEYLGVNWYRNHTADLRTIPHTSYRHIAE